MSEPLWSGWFVPIAALLQIGLWVALGGPHWDNLERKIFGDDKSLTKKDGVDHA